MSLTIAALHAFILLRNANCQKTTDHEDKTTRLGLAAVLHYHVVLYCPVPCE